MTVVLAICKKKILPDWVVLQTGPSLWILEKLNLLFFAIFSNAMEPILDSQAKIRECE